jgi:hypothetical protein
MLFSLGQVYGHDPILGASISHNLTRYGQFFGNRAFYKDAGQLEADHPIVIVDNHIANHADFGPAGCVNLSPYHVLPAHPLLNFACLRFFNHYI